MLGFHRKPSDWRVGQSPGRKVGLGAWRALHRAKKSRWCLRHCGPGQTSSILGAWVSPNLAPGPFEGASVKPPISLRPPRLAARTPRLRRRAAPSREDRHPILWSDLFYKLLESTTARLWASVRSSSLKGSTSSILTIAKAGFYARTRSIFTVQMVQDKAALGSSSRFLSFCHARAPAARARRSVTSRKAIRGHSVQGTWQES